MGLSQEPHYGDEHMGWQVLHERTTASQIASQIASLEPKRTYIHICTYIYTYTYTYIHTHIFIYIYT